MDNQKEKICCYCKINPGVKKDNPLLWNGFLDNETKQLVCWNCHKEHYRIKSENGTKPFSMVEFPVFN